MVEAEGERYGESWVWGWACAMCERNELACDIMQIKKKCTT